MCEELKKYLEIENKLQECYRMIREKPWLSAFSTCGVMIQLALSAIKKPPFCRRPSAGRHFYSVFLCSKFISLNHSHQTTCPYPVRNNHRYESELQDLLLTFYSRRYTESPDVNGCGNKNQSAKYLYFSAIPLA